MVRAAAVFVATVLLIALTIGVVGGFLLAIAYAIGRGVGAW